MTRFILNNELVETGLPSGYVLLDFIRKNKGLTGTKEGCREGDCGACTVLVGEYHNTEIKYINVNSCLMPIGSVNGKHVVTIEGLNTNKLNPVQEAFVYEGGTQCGFCTSGFIVSLMGYIITNINYKFEDAIEYISGNICRCTGYEGIKRAIWRALNEISKLKINSLRNYEEYRIELVKYEIIPDYFLTIKEKLKQLNSIKQEDLKIDRNYLVGGGTDLYVQKLEELVDKNVIIISNDESYREIFLSGKEIYIGGGCTVSMIESSEIIDGYYPELKDFLKLFGSKQIRNKATVAGNIVNASPIGDLTNMLIALGAKIILSSGREKRTLSLKDFYKGYKNLDKAPDELIESIIIQIPEGKYLFNFEKVSRRIYLDIASVNSSFFANVENGYLSNVRISAGGVAPIPLYLKKTSKLLENVHLNSELIFEAANTAQREISPITDARGSAEYKSLLLRQLILAHFQKFYSELVKPEIIFQWEV